MKVDSSKILKPGIVLTVKKIDWSDPEVRWLVAYTKREQRKLERLSRYNPEAMRRIITI